MACCFCLFAEKFTEVLNKQREERAERDRERIRLLTADPFDPEAQHLIAEEIRQENIIISCCCNSVVSCQSKCLSVTCFVTRKFCKPVFFPTNPNLIHLDSGLF